MSADDYDNYIVSRSAPRWAWETIDQSLALDATSSGSDKSLREQVQQAIDGMSAASEHEQLTSLSPKEATFLAAE